MPAHVFVLDEGNYEICIRRGLVGLPSAGADARNKDSTNDALLSRLLLIREGDYVLFYVTGKKELRGVWRAIGQAFYDETEIWAEKTYPFRFRLESTEFSFESPLKLKDIHDLRNAGRLWTFALQRASGSNAMFAISNAEFDAVLQEFLKVNPFTTKKNVVLEPYPVKPANALQEIHFLNETKPRYEYSVMALLANAFTQKKFQDIFGTYSDYLQYVPTSLGTEMDYLLYLNHPLNPRQTMSYNIIEVKLDRFDRKNLSQLIGYEAWFLRNKVQGDMNMVRVSAIAQRFDDDVVDYVTKRKQIEGKEIKLLKYEANHDGSIALKPLDIS